MIVGINDFDKALTFLKYSLHIFDAGLVIVDVNVGYKPTDFNPELHIGFDLRVRKDYIIGDIEEISMVVKADTGVKIAFPRGTWLSIVPRSGLSYKTPIRIPNSPGTVEASYRNEIGVLLELRNPSEPPYTIEKGTKVAQAIPCANALRINAISKLFLIVPETFEQEDEYDSLRTLAESEDIVVVKMPIPMWGKFWDNWAKLFSSTRGEAGYGSTGLK